MELTEKFKIARLLQIKIAIRIEDNTTFIT